MIGLIIAGIYALIQFLSHADGYSIFLNSTNLMFRWYVATTPVVALIYFSFAKRIGLEFASKLGLFTIMIFTIIRGGLIFCSWLLHHSLSFATGEYRWNFVILIIGAIFVLLFVLKGKMTIKKNNRKFNLNI